MVAAGPMAPAAVRRSGPFSDLGTYFLSRPVIPTLIEFPSLREREDYSHRILQRIGVSVTGYSVLNIHRVGIEAPVIYVFDELSDWEGRPRCWPNWIATLDPSPDDAAPPSTELDREVPAPDVPRRGSIQGDRNPLESAPRPRKSNGTIGAFLHVGSRSATRSARATQRRDLT